MMYDEEGGQDLEQNEPGVAETAAKNAGKKVANKAKKASKKAMKKMIKRLVMMFGFKIIVILAIILVVVGILGAVVYKIKVDDGKRQSADSKDAKGNAPYVVSDIALDKATIVDDGKGNYYIGFKKENDDGTEVTLDIDEATNEIAKTLKENGNVLKDYISKDESKQKELIKKMIIADIYTKYPKVGKKGLQGCIQVVKPSVDNYIAGTEGEIELTYKSENDFNTMVEEGDEKVLDCYTMNEDGAFIIASTGPDGGITKCAPQDISSSVNKYAMPFDYLWALLITSSDLEFVENIIDLVMESEITLTVFEEEQTTTTYTRNQYKEETSNIYRADFYAYLKSSAGGYLRATSGETNPMEQEVQEKNDDSETITNSKLQKLKVTRANTWLLKFETQYNKVTTKYGTQGYPEDGMLRPTNKEEEIVEGEYEIQETGITWGSCPDWCKSEFESFIADKQKTGNYHSYTLNIEKKVTTRFYDYKSGTNTYTETTKYEENGNNTTEKTLLHSTESNFVTYLKNSTSALKNLKIELDWLEEILEGNEKADYMIDITKYLMYKATGIDYGVKEFSFNEYNPNSFSSVSAIYGNTIQEKVWFALRDLGIPEIAVAGAMGNIHYESGGFSPSAVEGDIGIGIGLCQWSFERREKLEAYAESKGKVWQDEDIQIEFLIGELTRDGGADGYAIFQMRSNYDDWINADSIQEATKAFCDGFERPNTSVANIPTRASWAEAYYNEFKGRQKPTGGSSGSANGDGYSQVYTSSSGKTYKEYKQYEGSYKNDMYWNYGPISSQGCSITAIAITLTGYGLDVNPSHLAHSAVLDSHYGNYRISYSREEKGSDVAEKISNNLRAGKPIVINIRGNLKAGGGSKYYYEHWVAILDINSQGQVYISDPGSSLANGWANLNDIVDIIQTDGRTIIYVTQ